MFHLKNLWKFGAALVTLAILVAAIILWPEKTVQETHQGQWTCSMHPQVRQDRPGQCPICGMNLVPVSRLAETVQLQQVGIETEEVKYRELYKELRTVGKLDYNEARVAYIAARVSGRVDRTYADFTGIRVRAGDHLVDIYSPELFSAQAELLLALERYEKATEDRTFALTNLESARTKLRLLGILPEQLQEIENSRKLQTHLTVYAPIGGTVIEKSVRTGQYVREGDPLYRIAELDPIWLYLNIFEYDLGWVRYGQQVEATVEAYQREVFRGTVTFIDPFLDDTTRTVKVRVNLKNPDGRLKPAMYATAVIRVKLLGDGLPEPTGLEGKYICPMHPEVVQEEAGYCTICQMPLERVPDPRASRPAASTQPARDISSTVTSAGLLAIPAAAVLDTGRRKIAYRRTDDGNYELVELELGPLAQGSDDAGKHRDYYPVFGGLKAGDRVVTRGGFLLDSQRQISGLPSLLFEEGRSVVTVHAGHSTNTGSPRQPDAHKH